MRPGARDVLVLRDPRESVRKCSLTPLRGRPGLRIVEYRPERSLAAEGRILLHPEGGLLGAADAGRGLLLLDCAWRRVPALLARVEGPYELRRLPPLRTAYPRRSRLFQDPDQGLASVEALFAALHLLGERDEELLSGYRFGADFLRANPVLA